MTPDLLACCDSWFWYSNNDLLIPINAIRDGTKTLLAKGKNGAKLSDVVGATPALWDDFKSAMSGYPTIRCVWLSAGGDDFAGVQHVQSLLKVDCSVAASADDCFDPSDPANNVERQPWRMLRELATNYDVYLVETAGALQDADWANEMHPTAGFQKLGECFRPLLPQLISGPPG